MSPERFAEMLKEERDLVKSQIEDDVRQRFHHIINGKGVVIPRIAVKIAVDDVFGPEKPSILVDDGLTPNDWKDIEDASREARDWVPGEEYRALQERVRELEEALREIVDNTAIIYFDIDGVHRYKLNHRAHHAITEGKIVLEGGEPVSNRSVKMEFEQEFVTILCDACGREFVLLNIHRYQEEDPESPQIIPAKRTDYCPWCGGRRRAVSEKGPFPCPLNNRILCDNAPKFPHCDGCEEYSEDLQDRIRTLEAEIERCRLLLYCPHPNTMCGDCPEETCVAGLRETDELRADNERLRREVEGVADWIDKWRPASWDTSMVVARNEAIRWLRAIVREGRE